VKFRSHVPCFFIFPVNQSCNSCICVADYLSRLICACLRERFLAYSWGLNP
jgi:hypothetical protein